MSRDGLRGSEGTFSPGTVAYVDALAQAGRFDQACEVLEKMLTYATQVVLVPKRSPSPANRLARDRVGHDAGAKVSRAHPAKLVQLRCGWASCRAVMSTW